MDIATIFKESRLHMEKAIESAKREFSGVRSGKASPAITGSDGPEQTEHMRNETNGLAEGRSRLTSAETSG